MSQTTSHITQHAASTTGALSAAASSLCTPEASLNLKIDAACAQACQAIAPAWPLDRAIAVNPHWSRIARPIREVAARMAVLGAIQVFPARRHIQQAWREARIQQQDLSAALKRFPTAQRLSVEQCIAALSDNAGIPRLPLLIDILDDDLERGQRLSWRQAITHQVSQTCAAYFDQQQADWQPESDAGLYAFWRETLTHDYAIGTLMGLPEIAQSLSALPATRQDAERWVLQRLGLPETTWADYLEAILLTVNGWASWCAYLAWQAQQSGQSDEHLRDLLAIRLAWGAILLDCKDDSAAQTAFASLQEQWLFSAEKIKYAEETLIMDEVWQLALEIGYQRQLAQQLTQSTASQSINTTAAAPEVQAVFCIDVRSEPLRRALEAAHPALQTIGFAGFFGLPVAYTPFATAATRPQLPGLLPATLQVTDRISPALVSTAAAQQALNTSAQQARLRNFAWSEQMRSASRWPSSAFSYVEAAGLAYAGKLARWLQPTSQSLQSTDLTGLPARYQRLCRPALYGMDIQAKVQLAARVLHAMGLDTQLAATVLLVGHGSQSKNNAHAAALDCGACCGQTGEVNARVLARLLNEPEVRAGLSACAIEIPEHTVFIAALHNTTTDEINGFDLDLLTAAARARWDTLHSVFARAGDQVRRERAATLGLNADTSAEQLLMQLRRRANDGAQTRPEWGLAGNAAFIIAPRQRSIGLDLNGRSFLHDYDSSQDADGSVLELLMTAPMLVTHWINLQYHASVCDPQRLGSGNKVLHNVVGGHIGVFEGNGGDLRIGLAQQSLHDGQRWMHEPLRLTVIIDAPSHAIEKVIAQHRVVQQLLDNGWIHLWRFAEVGLSRYENNSWQALEL